MRQAYVACKCGKDSQYGGRHVEYIGWQALGPVIDVSA